MWFDNIENLPTIAAHTGFSIFELPKNIVFSQILPNAYHVRKTKKNEQGSGAAFISIDQIRDIFPMIDAKQSQAFHIVIEEAELMNEQAINCFLKHLEEPHENIHQILLTNDLNRIIPTVRSRAQIYRLKTKTQISDAPEIDPKILALAKEYLSCTPQQLPSFAKKLTKDSKIARDKTTQVVDAAITLMYKSYFATGNQKFLDKLERLLQLQQTITNGNLKLQLVACML